VTDFLGGSTPKKYFPLELEVIYVENMKPAPPGFKWIFTRYRRVKNSTRILDARDYGYDCWAFLVRA
jgi:hypothetical protein